MERNISKFLPLPPWIYKFSLSNNVQSYTKLNLDLHELLDDFISNKSSKQKYITEIKNALKYSEDSIFRLI